MNGWMPNFPQGSCTNQTKHLKSNVKAMTYMENKFGYEKTYGGAIIILWVKLLT